MKLRIGCAVVGFLLFVLSLAAQTAGSSSASSQQVPPLIPFSNVATDQGGNSLSGVASITFSLYNSQQGGEPLWTETQNNVQFDSTGHYSVQLGITKRNGVPTVLFTTGEARWLGVRIAEQAEQPRVLLLSVPYALKAGDAATIGGLPPSAFVLAAPLSGAASASAAESATGQGAPPPSGDVTGTGKVDYLPLWDSTSDIISSVLFQKGTGSTAKIGINTATPATTLDVKGAGTIRGTLSLPATGAATATVGKNSQPLNLAASAFNSTSSTAVNQTFQWQSEPAGNDTSTPSGTLNLLFGEGATKPSETGLNIASNGQITFATGQTFPGTGNGTITGVNTAAGSGLTGGGTSGTLNLGLLTTCATNQILQWTGSAWACATISGGGTITGVTAGTDLTGGGTSGNVTLNLDTTKVPQLNTANTFTGDQNVTGNVAATGSVSGAAATFTGLVTEAGALLPASGTATASQGFDSQPLDSVSSVFNSTGGTAQNQDFRWLAEPVGNDTGSPSAKLDLLFGANGATPTETGLSVANNGIITFATGQTFGTGGGGTVTSVGSGLGLKGGPITTSGTLTIDTTVVPQLGAANTFTANQTLNGTLTANSSGNTIVGSTSGAADSGVTGVGSTTNGTGVLGIGANGVAGQSSYVNGDGVFGSASSTTGTATGVLGTTLSPTGYGVQGTNQATTGNAVGVYGTTQSATGYGVEGNSPSFIGVYGTGAFGVDGYTTSPSGSGVQGYSQSATGPSAGVFGIALSPAGYGAEGVNQAQTGPAVAVYGQSLSSAGYGVEGYSPNVGVFGQGLLGVQGTSLSAGGTGVNGAAAAATGNGVGVVGSSNSPTSYGVEGIDNATSGGTAGLFQVFNGTATILQGTSGGITEFKVDSAGDVIAAGAVSGNTFQIGGNLFAFGSNTNGNAFLGFAGSLTANTTTSDNTAVGYSALAVGQGTSEFNTAVGALALSSNTTASDNTGIGYGAGNTNDDSSLTGSNNTVVGASAFLSTGTLTNATAIGAHSLVSSSNALVLGGITGVNGGTSVNVGIGTTAPGHLLDVAGTAAVDSTGLNNGSNFIDLTFGLNAGEGMSSSRTAGPNQYGIDLYTDFARRISIEQHGNVGIGTTSPDNLLTVNGSADKPGGGSWGTYSDGRLKTVNGGFTPGLNQVMKIHPVHYRYKADNAMGIRDTDEHIGVVAQDVQKVIPEAVTQNSKGYLLVNNDPIIWTMLNAIKEQQREIKKQQNLLRTQSAAMRSLQAEVRETRESLRKVKAQVAAGEPALVAAR
jgi:hypothetical protein